MKFVLVQTDAKRDALFVASVCENIIELLNHPFNLDPRRHPPRVHKVEDKFTHNDKKLLAELRRQTRLGLFQPLPSIN